MPEWVYKRSEDRLWTVGYYAPDGSWEPESDHDSKEAAAAWVHYLNGGQKPPEPGPSFAFRTVGELQALLARLLADSLEPDAGVMVNASALPNTEGFCSLRMAYDTGSNLVLE